MAQPWQVRDLDPHRSGDHHSKRLDRGGLVHDDQYLAVVTQPGEQVPEPGLVLRQGLVMESLAVVVEGAGMVFFLAHIQAQEHVVVAGPV